MWSSPHDQRAGSATQKVLELLACRPHRIEQQRVTSGDWILSEEILGRTLKQSDDRVGWQSLVTLTVRFREPFRET